MKTVQLPDFGDIGAVEDRVEYHLEVLKGRELGTRYPLAKAKIVIGRNPMADIWMDETGVSRQHAMLVRDSITGGYRIEDLGSTNGVLVNGDRVSGIGLRNGDRIAIGRALLKYRELDPEEIEYRSQLDKLLTKDDLTGLIIYRRFNVELARQVRRAVQEDNFLTLLMMDMDGLKKINDCHGHPVGAYTISQTGRLIGEIMRRHRGAASRFGGDEFIAYLPERTKKEALPVAEEIRHTIETYKYQKGEVLVRPTISIGVATLPDDGSIVSDLTILADEALYRAKRGGRNRVSI